MPRHIAIIQGHPDSSTRHFCHALADEYAKGAEDGGHDVMRIEVATLAPLAVLIVVFGVAPTLLSGTFASSVATFLGAAANWVAP